MSDSIEVHVFGGKKGESIALRLPGDLWGVIDTYAPTVSNPQSNPTVRFLESRNVDRLHFLCLTHPHEDHYRGMSYLLEHFDPDRIWIFGPMTHRYLRGKIAAVIYAKTQSNILEDGKENADELVRILDAIRDLSKKKQRTPAVELRHLQLEQPLLTLSTVPPLKITAIGPPAKLAMRYADSLDRCFTSNERILREVITGVNHNLISGGLLIEYGASRIILGGDMEVESWEEAVKSFHQNGSLGSGLVKVSHHGSANGFCDGLWAKLSPGKSALAVITPYTSQGLPSLEGLRHIMDHANSTFSPSLSGLMLANDWESLATYTDFTGLSMDILLALRSFFPKAHPTQERFEGRCSFRVAADGTITNEMNGEAGKFHGNWPLNVREWNITKRTEQQRFFEFRKSEIYNPSAGFGSPDYDPYPQFKDHDVAERDPIAHEIIIEGHCISDEGLQMGTSLMIGGRPFTITKLIQELLIDGVDDTFVASHFETLIQPMDLLRVIRYRVLTPPKR